MTGSQDSKGVDIQAGRTYMKNRSGLQETQANEVCRIDQNQVRTSELTCKDRTYSLDQCGARINRLTQASDRSRIQ